MARSRFILSAGVAAAALLAAAVAAAAVPTPDPSPLCAELSDVCAASAASAPCVACVETCGAAADASDAAAAVAVPTSATAVAACKHRLVELDVAAGRGCWPLYNACIYGGSGRDAQTACGVCTTECADKHPEQAKECADRD